MPKEQTFAFRLTNADKAALDEVATASGMTVAGWIRRAAQDALLRNRDREAATQLTPEELHVAAKMGLRPHEYLEGKAQ